MADWLIPALQKAGFKGDSLRTMWAIIQRESGGNPKAFNPRKETQDLSYGLTQLNMLGKMGADRRKQWGLTSNEQLFDPATNLKAAYRLSGGGTNFGAWGIGKDAYRSGAGWDTIKKHWDRFPGAAPAGKGATAPAATATATGTRKGGLTLAQMNALAKQFGFKDFSKAFGIPPKQARELFRTATVAPLPTNPAKAGFKATPTKGGGKGVAELFYDPAGKGQQWSPGWTNPIGGHSDHVHVSFSDPRTALQLIQMGLDMGLSVRENPYLETVDGNHVPGSFHGQLFEGLYDGKKLGKAIDVSGSPQLMMNFYRAARRYIG